MNGRYVMTCGCDGKPIAVISRLSEQIRLKRRAEVIFQQLEVKSFLHRGMRVVFRDQVNN